MTGYSKLYILYSSDNSIQTFCIHCIHLTIHYIQQCYDQQSNTSINCSSDKLITKHIHLIKTSITFSQTMLENASGILLTFHTQIHSAAH